MSNVGRNSLGVGLSPLELSQEFAGCSVAVVQVYGSHGREGSRRIHPGYATPYCEIELVEIEKHRR